MPRGKFRDEVPTEAEDGEQPTFDRPNTGSGKRASDEDEDEEQPSFSRPVTRPRKS